MLIKKIYSMTYSLFLINRQDTGKVGQCWGKILNYCFVKVKVLKQMGKSVQAFRSNTSIYKLITGGVNHRNLIWYWFHRFIEKSPIYLICINVSAFDCLIIERFFLDYFQLEIYIDSQLCSWWNHFLWSTAYCW